MEINFILNQKQVHITHNTEHCKLCSCTCMYYNTVGDIFYTHSAVCFFSFSSLIRKGSLTSCEEELREVGNCLFLYYNSNNKQKSINFYTVTINL